MAKIFLHRLFFVIAFSLMLFLHTTVSKADISQFIEENYGISIATSSVHINLGIDDLDKLFAAIRLLRCEASLFLSISASSPFLNNKLTDNHSQRWIQFPRTPKEVPFFHDHQHYISWIQKNIQNGIWNF